MTERMSAGEFRDLKQERTSKYRNKKVVVAGHRFDSIKESKRYIQLKALETAGEISHLEIQPVFRLTHGGKPLRYDSGRQVVYKADFSYFDGDKRIVEDVKSPATRTPQYKIKKAIVQAMFPAVQIVEV